jgi:hypothetical protein
MPVYDRIYVKESADKNYRITLKLPQGKVVAKRDTDIVFSISDALGNPITDLEPLMGAGGHSVIISSEMQNLKVTGVISWLDLPIILHTSRMVLP